MIAVLGDEAVADALTDAVHASDAATIADAALVVAVGDDALAETVDLAPETPILAVGVDRAIPSVDPDPGTVAAAVERFRDGDADTVDRTLLSVAVGDRRYRALFDVMLVTAEPAQISAYRIATDDHDTIDDVRADGVVVATPAGSRGYARDAGGPTLAYGTNALAAVPVAPFTVDPHRWVAPPPLTLTVARDEGTVELRIDGRERAVVAPDDPVRLACDGVLTVIAPGEPAAMEKT